MDRETFHGTVLGFAMGLAVATLGCSDGSASPNGSGDASALGPGCLGSAGKPCSPYPEGTECPGGPTVCVQCATDLYVPSPSFCRCTSGTWDCGPPEAAQLQCPTPVANADFYVDPSCSVPYVGDGGKDVGGEAGACTPVVASDYDQSCDADTDCVVVGEAPECPLSGCWACDTAAVNWSVAAAFTKALAATEATASSSPCNCPCESTIAICRAGICQPAGCTPPGADTLPACVDAGGQCSYRANATCNNGAGPPDACAYADEFCCIN